MLHTTRQSQPGILTLKNNGISSHIIHTEKYSAPYQTSMIEAFAKIIND